MPARFPADTVWRCPQADATLTPPEDQPLTEEMMATTANPTQARMQDMSPRDQFLSAFEKEHATTLKVLRAFPAGKEEVQPAPKCKNARELAWIFVGEMGMAAVALTTGFDWSNPPTLPPAPQTIPEIIVAFDAAHEKVVEILKGTGDAELLTGTVQFPVGKGQMGDCDQIHHRGQFSIYLRMADGKLPSIYGPTADEPWF
jgi:hypothetical protein